jgi:hypothetical protein
MDWVTREIRVTRDMRVTREIRMTMKVHPPIVAPESAAGPADLGSADPGPWPRGRKWSQGFPNVR